MKHLTETTSKVSLRAVTAALALSLFAAATCFGQAGAAAEAGMTEEETTVWVVSEPGQVVELGDVINSAVTISGTGSDVIVSPGLHTVNGDFTMDASSSHMVVGFSKKKVAGHLDVNGTLLLGPENRPELSLNLKNARFVKGDKFVICSARKIVGEFVGLDNGSKFEHDNLTLLISYSGEEITLTVTDISRPNYPSITPVVEINSDLVYPTSTGPLS